MKLNELFEAPNDEVAIIFGRFNPPHKGHRAAWELANQSANWFVGTNRSTVGLKDPLPYDVKVEAMKTIYPEIEGHLMPETSWVTMASKIYEKFGDIKLLVLTDEDWVTKTLQQYNGIEGKPHGFYNFANIEQKSTPRLSSATALRDAVANNDKESFTKAAGIDADTEVAGKSYFDLVSEYMAPYLEKEKAKAEKTTKKKTKETVEDTRTSENIDEMFDPFEPVSNLEYALYLLTVLSIPIAALGPVLFKKIKNQIAKMGSRSIINMLSKKQISVDRATKTLLEKLLDDLRKALYQDDGEKAKKIALQIKQIAKKSEDNNPMAAEDIRKVKDGYRLVSKKSGRNLGTYPTRAGAEKRERQVQYFKHAGESVEEGKFRSRDIEEKLIPNDKLNDLKSKYLPDWEMLDHRILQAKYVAKDHRHAEDFVSYINKISEEMDHFAEVTQDVAEVTVKTTTFDVKGLTILDFKLALKVDKFADRDEIEQVRMSGNFGMHESRYGRYWCSTDKKWKNRKGPKQKRSS